jgi:hypothetical protein
MTRHAAQHRRIPPGRWRRPKRLLPVDVDQLALLVARSMGWCEVSATDACTRKASRVHRRVGGLTAPVDDPIIDRLSNLLHACARCRDWIEDGRQADVEALGLVLHGSQEPTAAVVLYRGDFALLDDAGGVYSLASAAGREADTAGDGKT